jgi:hypothetical protein
LSLYTLASTELKRHKNKTFMAYQGEHI